MVSYKGQVLFRSSVAALTCALSKKLHDVHCLQPHEGVCGLPLQQAGLLHDFFELERVPPPGLFVEMC